MPSSSRQLLDAAYSRLHFQEGDLLDAGAEPTAATAAQWVNKGDWLALAKKVKAEKVFFVNENPVIVFAEQSTNDPAEWMRYFNSVWCMARPQMLFLAREGELSVLNLTKKPARPGEAPSQHNRLLGAAKAAAEVLENLNAFRREQVESGRLFEDERFGFDDRADRALVRDLGKVRKALINAGLEPGYAHALIGRSIFIRYLEDRRVLDADYFRKVAKGDPEQWPAIINEAINANIDFGSGQPILYPYVLSNKGFTYALFSQLAHDFNGDMFPMNSAEENAVLDPHLEILQNFLLGGKNEQLFFFAYRFDIIPIELISSIYEKFYSLKRQKRRDEGSYYTPSALVDFVLAETLTPDFLATDPRVLDPACGSGIFLVEAFRRIVRYRVQKAGGLLSADELREILRDQIAGIDISADAVRVAAFSLYLAMLHYLEPPSIQKNKRLPCLTFSTRAKTRKDQHYDILVAVDAFKVEKGVSNPKVRERFLSNCADVVVGNPPWGAPQNKDVPVAMQSDGGIGWCDRRELSVGDKERSQTFLHRTRDLLRSGGRAGLLVSTGVFFKRGAKTKLFREQWLDAVTLRKVVNFAAVRHSFFQNGSDPADPGKQGAIAPFAAVLFDNIEPVAESRFTYWSCKETAFVKRVQAVVLNHADVRIADQAEYRRDDVLWKIYWWGGHRDHALIQRLRHEHSFKDVVDPDGKRLRVGFQVASKKDPAKWLKNYPWFDTDDFERYGVLPTHKFKPPPPRVHRRRTKLLYQGARLLIKRGVGNTEDTRGRIAARFETEKFSFRDSIFCARLAGDEGQAQTITEEQAKVILATIWSSLVRYYLFMTSGTWGPWHDEVKKDVLHSLPIRFPDDPKLAADIVEVVDELRNLPEEVEQPGLFSGSGMLKADRDRRIRQLESELDKLVYKLFHLTDAERDRVEEFCRLDLDLFYRGMASDALKPLNWPDSLPRVGRRADLHGTKAKMNDLSRYISTFLDVWEPQLADQHGRLRWRVVQPADVTSMTAVIFETETADDPLPGPSDSDGQEWHDLLARMNESTRVPTSSKRVYIDGLVRLVGDSEIALIKRNEHRLWTTSAARDDAEASMVLAFHLTDGFQPGALSDATA